MLNHRKIKLELNKILEGFEEVVVIEEQVPVALVEKLLSYSKISANTIYPAEKISQKLEKHLYSNGLCYSTLLLVYEDDVEQYVIQEDILSDDKTKMPIITLTAHKEIKYISKLSSNSFTTPDAFYEVVTTLMGDKKMSYSNAVVNRLVSPKGIVIPRTPKQKTRTTEYFYDFGEGNMSAILEEDKVTISKVCEEKRVFVDTKTHEEFEAEMEKVLEEMPIVINDHLMEKVYVKK